MTRAEASEPGRFIKSNQLDIQTVDFLGPCDTIKQLFTLPYEQNTTSVISLHRMGALNL
jgi:hypothetical protein